MTAAARSPWAPSRPLGAVAAGLAVFLAVTITTGLLIWADGPAGPARAAGEGAPGSGTGAPVGQLDAGTSTARIGPASLVLPGEPYVTHPDPKPLDGVLDLFFWAAATVHPRYDGRHDWSAAVLLGRLPDGSGTGDLEVDGPRAVQQLSRSFFGAHRTRVTDLTVADHAVDGHPGVLVSATVHYAVPDLPSRADRVDAVLVRLDDGALVVAASAVPDDADEGLAQQAAASLRTLSIG